MFALARCGGRPVRLEMPHQDVGPDDVMVRVRLVGICRTDLAVARGEIAVEEPRVLGHEFSGDVVAVGVEVHDVRVNDFVGANPVISCGKCARCRTGFQPACGNQKFLGIDRDGAIAETIVIPARNAWPMPVTMDARVVAMLEPVAACAAVTRAPISPHQRGLILGTGRLARLSELILRQYGFTQLDCRGLSCEDRLGASPDQYDFAVDTQGSAAAFEHLLEALRPQGTLILKSRPTLPIPVDLRAMLPKEPSIHLVNYASFEEARRLLVDERLDISELLGPIWSADDFDKAMEAAARDEGMKHFIAAPVQAPTTGTTPGSAQERVRNRCVSL